MDKQIEIIDNVIKFLDTSGKQVEAHSMSSQDVNSIHIENITVNRLFKKIPTKRISIMAQGIDRSLIVYEYKVGAEEFEKYVRELVAYAKKYHIAYRLPEDE